MLTDIHLMKLITNYFSNCIFSTKHNSYAPNFKEVDGAYWFRVVRASVRSSRTLHARILTFHIWIPHGKIAETCFFFLSELSPILELCPFEKIRMKSDVCHIL